MMKGMVADLVIIQVEAGFHIGDRLGGEGIDFSKILHRDLFRIDPESAHRVFTVGSLIEVELLRAQQLSHSFHKFNG